MMYYFTPDTIVQANNNIKALDSKVGGLMCILSCLAENIEENVSYTINGESLRKQLSFVFDKEPKDSFEGAKPSYIIFAKDWATTFFNKIIKNKVDLLSCAVFFLRRQSFEKEYNREEVIDLFIKRFNLENYKESWFYDSTKLQLDYNQSKVEENQAEFYIKMEYTTSFKSVLFDGVIKNSAAELKSAGQIQTLYSGSGIQTCLLLSDEPLDQRYVMSNSGQNMGVDNIMSLRGISNEEMSVDDLADILKNMYNNPEDTGKAMTPQLFGLKYGAVIDRENYALETIVTKAGLPASYTAEIRKGINIYKAIKNNEYGISVFQHEENSSVEAIVPVAFDFNAVKGTAINKIFFGTPGCGKSYHIEHDILGKTKDTGEYYYEKKNIIRTTFYQDYSNTDFVGQILPKVVKGQNGASDTVEYIFNPGPFTLALIQAISNPNKKVALVIEEINRGNAPAIFGDVFQLLDRNKDGISEYGIVNVSLMDYLNDYEFVVDGQKCKYTFTEIKIPGNLDIFATMNTSDQNVYTLDTAFVRRWEKVKIKNTFDDCAFANIDVPGMPGYSWKTFVTGINNWIAKHLEDLQVNEDKQIGVFFVKESLLTSGDAEKFAFKVFDYLWSDVAKLDHGIFFNPYDTLEDLITAYQVKGVDVFKPGVFK